MITYVYIWKDTNRVPFYVGCTTSTRRFKPGAVRTTGRTQACRAKVEQIGATNVIVELHTCTSIEAAIELERHFIELYGRLRIGTGTLVNVTAGGEHQTEAARKKMSIKSLQYQEKINPGHTPKPPKKTKEEIAAIRSANMKSLNANVDFTEQRLVAISSPETREKISLGVYASMEQRLATMQTPEVQAKLRKPKSAEHNKKVSDAKKLWWANKKAGL